MKTTYKHITKTGEIKTRKSEREYGYVVVASGTSDEQIASLRKGADLALDTVAEYERDRETLSAKYGAEEVERWITDELDRSVDYRDKAAHEEATKSEDKQHDIISWHLTRENAEKAIGARNVRRFRVAYVEAINGGER